ncbi:unnamed protein product [Bursaphelenchus xylophilus]|uniref:(pine wood nematode) hypothetical protein n=1 Tax=Bursaphelenchus xylophilus TaxID=6326 RepID=A0A1I7RV15_BURXY|nr:unnamed protein product [Bursaphelenchus xylophilus]CAG9105211.1 unnamed protein product [Bursaphelenchus xylophilus]
MIRTPMFSRACHCEAYATYLAVVPWKGLDQFHCRIIPSEHYTSQVTVDEDVFAELRLWRKGLVAMFRAQDDEDCVFIETAKNVKNTLHMNIECIPLPRESGDLAPIYFKQALEQAGERWGTHRKIINLADTKEKSVRRAIPPGFSYFAIDFGLQPGYAHVIENEDTFPAHFAQEIIAGMLDLDHKLWRRPEKETLETLKQKRDAFRERWAAFDWTETARQRVNEAGGSQEE